MPDLAALTPDDFEAIEGSDFTITGPGSGPLTVRLAQVVRLAEPPPGHRHPFSLRFGGPAAPALEQGIQHLVHAELGDLEVFLVPITADRDSMTYEAVFG
jgi:hypothetical protein